MEYFVMMSFIIVPKHFLPHDSHRTRWEQAWDRTLQTPDNGSTYSSSAFASVFQNLFLLKSYIKNTRSKQNRAI